MTTAEILNYLAGVRKGDTFTLRDFTYVAKGDARRWTSEGTGCMVDRVSIEATRFSPNGGFMACADVYESRIID